MVTVTFSKQEVRDIFASANEDLVTQHKQLKKIIEVIKARILEDAIMDLLYDEE